MFKASKLHIYSIISLLILSFTLICFLRKTTTETILIDGDGSGHYSWLPSIFIYKTLDFKDVFESEKIRKGLSYQGHNYHDVNGITVNKFPPGTAFLMMPFFIIALIISSLLGMPVDGYSFIFQYSVGIAAVFWAMVGLIYSYRLLLTYNIKPKISFLLVLISFFGTNLFAYTYLMPAFSHVYSFALISLLLFYARSFFQKNTISSLVISSIILGLIITVRPVNILIILFIPFLASSSECFSKSVIEKFKDFKIVYAVFAFLLAISPYFIINYLQSGELFYYAYTNEGFNWADPEIVNFLFSFRKGWFIYTPFLLLIFPSMYVVYRKNKFEFIWFLLFIVVLVYVFSSWWNWFYGDSFGMRPMVDFTSVFILLISLYYSNLKGIIKSITLIFIILVISLNIIQSYQYTKGIIHPDSMDKEAYFYIFLRTDTRYSESISGGAEYYYGKLNANPFYEELNDFEEDYTNWAKLWTAESSEVFSGNKSVSMTLNNNFSPALNWKIPDSLINSQNLYVKIETMIFEPQKNSAKNALFIIDIQNEQGKTVFYKGAKLKHIPNNITKEWVYASTGFKIPHFGKEHYRIKIYVWNVQKTNFLVDDLKVGFYEYY